MTLDNRPIVVLTGPSASGKTDLALSWIEKYPCLEIISVDSAMIYRGMDIGTAKPSREILSKTLHHLIDIRDPLESYSVAEFCGDCHRAIQEIFSRGKIPLLVGGTMMYLNSLRNGLASIPPVTAGVREKLSLRLKEEGIQTLYESLLKADPLSAQRLKPGDTQRILRALEVFESTGSPLSYYWGNNQKIIKNPFTFLGLPVEDRVTLHQRIEVRTQAMLKNGLIDEVRRLYERGDLHLDLPAIRSVGYRQVWEYFLGQSSRENLHENITISTRQLAKRQITWMRSWPDIQYWNRDLNLLELFDQVF